MTDDNRARALCGCTACNSDVPSERDPDMCARGRRIATAILDAERRGAEKERERMLATVVHYVALAHQHPSPEPFNAYDALRALHDALTTPVPGNGEGT